MSRPLAIFTAISVAAHAALLGLWAGPDATERGRHESAIEIGLVMLPRIDLDNSRTQNLSNNQAAETISNLATTKMPPATPTRPETRAALRQEPEPLLASLAAPDSPPINLPTSEKANLPVTAVPGTTSGQKPAFAVEAAPLHASNPAPTYPVEALRYGWEGEVWLKVDVNRQGAVSHVSIDRSSGYPVLDRAAVQTVNTWQFEPAKVGSEAVDGTVRIPVRFKIRRT